MCSLLKLMQQHQQKQEEALQRQEERLQNQETRIRMPEEQKKELEFLNAMLGPPDACPEEAVWCVQRKIRGRLYPAESF